MAANMTMMIAECPKPFVNRDKFTDRGGYINGRFCSDNCCLPCPLQELIYSDEFEGRIRVSGWLACISLACSLFLLLTYAVLPKEKSHRHYLSIGLILSNILLQLAFIIPAAAEPDMCYDAITPRDMYSSMSCAWTGAFITWGGMGSVTWILSRSLWTHLRICWDISESRAFTIFAHVMGWGVPTLFTAITLKYTGVSYRLTNICFPNNENSFTTFFGWILAFAGLAFGLQLATSGYCFWIYLLNLWKTGSPTQTSLATTTNTSTTGNGAQTKPWKVPRQQAWSRVRKVFLLQWRNITLCMLVITIVALLSGVFVSLNEALVRDRARGLKAKSIAAWGTCLVITQDKNKCLPLAKQLEITEAPITVALIITSLVGVNTFMLLMRWTTIKAWWEYLRGKREKEEEDFFMVSPRRITFEQKLASEQQAANTVESPLESPITESFPSKGFENVGLEGGSASGGEKNRFSGLSWASSGSDGRMRGKEDDAFGKGYRESMFVEHGHEFGEKELLRKQREQVDREAN